MAGLFALVVVAALGGGLLTRVSPTVDEIKSRFELAQTYYAAKDYDNGVTIYGEIVGTPNRAILNVDTITVAIDEFVLPVRVAARYQVGNSLRNVGLDLLARSESALADGDTAVASVRRQEADRALREARVHFTTIVEDEQAPENVRVMSQYQVIRAAFALEDYRAVVGDVGKLQVLFPGNTYEEAALYDLGWAYFRMGEPENSISTFEQVLAISQDAVRIDRALFQIAESHLSLGRLARAQTFYQQLVDKYDFSALSEKDLRAMQTAKLRGVVQETTRELVAKAQIKIGDTHAQAGDVEAAIAAYSLVPERYPQEEYLVEQSYTRLAALVLEVRGLDAGIREYEQAIRRSEREEFKATTQLQVARLLYDDGRYGDAAEAYRVYWKGYSGMSRIVGFTRDKVLFKLGECSRQRGMEEAAEDPVSARAAFEQALSHYDSTLAYRRTSLAADATFGRGAAFQGLGELDSALVQYQAVVRAYPSHPSVPSALVQIARLHYESGAHQEAVETYERFLAEHSGSGLRDEVHMELGVVCKAMGQADRALAQYQLVGRASPNWVKVRVEIGDMLTAAGRYAEAQNQLDEAIAEAGDDPDAMAALRYIQGRIAYSQRRFDEAVPPLSRAIDSAPEAQVAASARFLRALSHYEMGKSSDAAGDSARGSGYYESVVADLERVLDGQVSARMRNVAFRTLGTTSTRLGRADETIRYYEELISRTEDAEERAGFLLLLTELYYDQRRFDETVKTAKRLIGEAFQDRDEMGYFLKERAYSVLASTELERRHYQSALQSASKGLKIYPRSGESASLAFAVGLSRYFLKEYEAAAVSFDEYVERFPGDGRNLEGMYYAGQCRQILGQYDGAAARFLQVAERFPNSSFVPEALFLAGENLYNGLEFDRALETYDRVLTRFPQGEYADDATYSSAWALFELKRMDDGVARMEDLVERYPGSPHAPRAQFTAGDYFYSIREYQRAQDAYAHLVEAYPASDEATRARDLIRELDEEIASRLYDAAVAQYQARDFEGAVAQFENIASAYPKTFTALAALGNMGVALEELGEEDRAEEVYQQVLRRAGEDPGNQEVADFARARLAHL